MAVKRLPKKKSQNASTSNSKPWLTVLLACIWMCGVQIYFQTPESSLASFGESMTTTTTTTTMIPYDLPLMACKKSIDDNNNNNNNNNSTVPPLVQTSKLQVLQTMTNHPTSQQPKPKRNVVVYVCGGGPYCEAVLDSIQQLRTNGGYYGDVVLIYNVRIKKNGQPEQDKVAESVLTTIRTMDNVTVFLDTDLIDDIIRRGEEASTSISTTSTANNNNNNTTTSTFNTSKFDYLRKPPPVAKCLKGHKSKKYSHQAKYTKLLIYHPKIAAALTSTNGGWNHHRVLYLDACMTYMTPHVDLLFEMPEVTNRLLAAPDPWIWRKSHMSGSINTRCPDQNALKALYGWVGGGGGSGDSNETDLSTLGYLNSALILYDTNIVRQYHTTDIPSDAATLIELLQLFHTLTPAFTGGDQLIQTVYWRHVRQDVYATMPLTLMDTDLVPYEFTVRLPNEPHILIGANGQRPVCFRRATTRYQLSTAKSLLNNNGTA